MGLPQGQTQLWVDNSGAVELSRDRKSCHRSRHVDRRYFKVRELVYAGELKVDWVATDDNVADLLTKSLSFAPFDKHRRRAMNASSEGNRGTAHMDKYEHAVHEQPARMSA